MLTIKCKIERKGGSKIDIEGQEYHFLPNSKGDHVCAVENPEHAKRFLSITEGYEAYFDDVKPASPATTNSSPKTKSKPAKTKSKAAPKKKAKKAPTTKAKQVAKPKAETPKQNGGTADQAKGKDSVKVNKGKPDEDPELLAKQEELSAFAMDVLEIDNPMDPMQVAAYGRKHFGIGLPSDGSMPIEEMLEVLKQRHSGQPATAA